MAVYASVVLATALAAGAVSETAAEPSPGEIVETADRVLDGSAYSLDETADYTFRVFEWVADRIRQFLRWLDEFFGLGDMLGSVSLGTIKFVIGLSLAVLLGILGYNGYVLYKMRRVPEETFATLGPTRTLSAAEMLTEAQRLSAEGNFVDASRRLFLAALILLEEKRGGRLRQGLTNSEYLHSFRTDWIRENLRVFVDLINWKWYRHQSFDAEDFNRCRAAYETIAARLEEIDT